MKVLKGIVLVALMMGLSSCGLDSSEDNKLVATQMRASRLTGQVGSITADGVKINSGATWGKVTNFNQASLIQFLYPNSTQSNLGQVSPYAIGSGVFIWGRVKSTDSNLKLRVGVNNVDFFNKIDLVNYQLGIEVWDQFSGQTFNNQQIDKAASIFFGKSGTVSSGEAIELRKGFSNIKNQSVFGMIFKDSQGAIYLDAGFESGMTSYGGVGAQDITGSFWYQHNGSNVPVYLGQFQIPTCGFFECQ